MENKKFEDAMEAIGQGVYELNMSEEESKDVNTVLSMVRDAYVPVTWPDVQELMEEEWFEEEAILALGSEDKTGSSAYFVPIKRIV